MPRDPSAHKRMRHHALACFGRLVPRLPERGVRSDGAPSRRANRHRQDGTMYTPFLLLVALILSAFPPAAQPQRGAAPMSGVTIVERLRSELLSVLDNEAGAAEDGNLPAGRFNDYLTRLGRPHPTVRQGSSCWWLWLLSGIDVCR